MSYLSKISSFCPYSVYRVTIHNYKYNRAPHSGAAGGAAGGGEPTPECGVGVRGGVQECGVQATP